MQKGLHIKGIGTLIICVKLYSIWFIHKGAIALTDFLKIILHTAKYVFMRTIPEWSNGGIPDKLTLSSYNRVLTIYRQLRKIHARPNLCHN